MANSAIVLSQYTSVGAPGDDSDSFNPLARATRALLHEGSGFTSATSVYFADAVTGLLRWFGLFVEGESGRLVFFPGLAGQPDRIGYQREGHPLCEASHLADHLTLEGNRERWHSREYTGTSSRKRRKRRPSGRAQGGPWTWPLGEGRVLWFGMSLQSAEFLRVVRANTIAHSLAPPSRDEVTRRMEVFRQATRNASTAGVLTVPGLPPPPPSALHFSVLVTPAGASDYTGSERGLSRSAAGFRLLAVNGTTTPFSSMTVSLGTAIRLQLFVMWVPAVMTAPIVLHATDETRSPTVRVPGDGA